MVTKVGSVKEIKSTLRLVFQHAVSFVNPRNLITSRVKCVDETLIIDDKKFRLNNNCYLVGFGKAVLGMAVQTESVLGNHLQSGILSIPVGQKSLFKEFELKENSRIKVYEGASDNMPDKSAENAAKQIEALARRLKSDDLLLVLVSGGGSALLPLPVPPVTLEEKTTVIKLLSRSGANITEINSVRKRISLLKGGGLINTAYPAEVVAFILSDVVGDPLDFIASGPTVFNSDEQDLPIKIMQKYSLLNLIPDSVKNILESPLKPLNRNEKVHNFVIGSNTLALNSAVEEIKKYNYDAIILSSTVEGFVSELFDVYINIILCTCKALNGNILKQEFDSQLQEAKLFLNISNKTFLQLYQLISRSASKKICFLLGGEPTVRVTGMGKGGRSQQLALMFSDALQKIYKEEMWLEEFNICSLFAGTDGIDGPTDAAGAIAYNGQIEMAITQNLNPSDYIKNCDSYTFFNTLNNGEDLIKIGHTGTNVMDIHLLTIELKPELS